MSFRATTESYVFHLSLDALDRLMKDDAAAARIIGSMSEHNIGITTWALSDALIPEVDRRIVATLLRVTDVLRGNPPDDDKGYRLTQSELGALANASRDLVNRILAGLQRQGLVAVSYGHVAILDAQKLEAIAFG